MTSSEADDTRGLTYSGQDIPVLKFPFAEMKFAEGDALAIACSL